MVPNFHLTGLYFLLGHFMSQLQSALPALNSYLATQLRQIPRTFARLPQHCLHNSQLSLPTVRERIIRRTTATHTKKQSVLKSFIHPFLNISRMKDNEKTHLKYSSITKSCNNMKKIKLRCSEWCTLHYIFSVFAFPYTQVSFEDVILLERSYPTNHSTARAKITIYSCMQHLLVWIMSIRNYRPHLGKGSAILFDGRKQLPNLIFVTCNVYKERLEHLTGTSFHCLQNQYKCIFFQEVQQHQIIH